MVEVLYKTYEYGVFILANLCMYSSVYLRWPTILHARLFPFLYALRMESHLVLGHLVDKFFGVQSIPKKALETRSRAEIHV